MVGILSQHVVDIILRLVVICVLQKMFRHDKTTEMLSCSKAKLIT